VHGILVICGNECTEWHPRFSQHPHDSESVEFWHLKIQESQIRSHSLDHLHCFGPRCGLADHFHVGKGAQHVQEKLPCRTPVVGDGNA
jgi:hypothetical protein